MNEALERKGRAGQDRICGGAGIFHNSAIESIENII